MAIYSGQCPAALYTINTNNRVRPLSARSQSKGRKDQETSPIDKREQSRSTRRELYYKSTAPNTAPHAARAMPVHPRVSGIHCVAGAALNEPGEVDAVPIAEGVVEGVDVDGAAVAENVRVALSMAQNCWARFSAEGTFVPQEDATHL